MLSTEREIFEKHFAQLCAGYNLPMTELRGDTYWRGIGKMPLPDVERVVEHCLGEEGPERFPTVNVCWQLSRQLKPQRARGALSHEPPEDVKRQGPPQDTWDIQGNTHLGYHFSRVLSVAPHRYGRVQADSLACVVRNPLREACIGVMVQAKHYWAQFMREDEAARDPDSQKRIWDEFIEKAESQCDDILAGRLVLEA